METQVINRRPARLRQNEWVRAVSIRLIKAGIRPNQVSVAGVLASGISALCLILVPQSAAAYQISFLLVAAVLISLRGLCNLCDGLMAVEGGMKSNSGEVFNDLPDRFSDSILFVAAGYSTGSSLGHELGWAVALLAVLTAYIRVLGASAGAGSCFSGPMAKPQRMMVMAGACVMAGLEIFLGREPSAVTIALLVIILGSAVTVLRRTRIVLAELEKK